MHKCGGDALLIYLIYLKYPMKINNLVSLSPNYLIFIGYFKTGSREAPSGSARETPLDPPLHHSLVLLPYQNVYPYVLDLSYANIESLLFQLFCPLCKSHLPSYLLSATSLP